MRAGGFHSWVGWRWPNCHCNRLIAWKWSKLIEPGSLWDGGRPLALRGQMSDRPRKRERELERERGRERRRKESRRCPYFVERSGKSRRRMETSSSPSLDVSRYSLRGFEAFSLSLSLSLFTLEGERNFGPGQQEGKKGERESERGWKKFLVDPPVGLSLLSFFLSLSHIHRHTLFPHFCLSHSIGIVQRQTLYSLLQLSLEVCLSNHNKYYSVLGWRNINCFLEKKDIIVGLFSPFSASFLNNYQVLTSTTFLCSIWASSIRNLTERLSQFSINNF